VREGLEVQRQSSEIVIVGGGIIGCATAYELARRGTTVTLIERGPIGREASWASAGIISLPNRPNMRPERVEISRRSLKRYPGLVEEIEERTGISVEYRRPGEIIVAVDDVHATEERARAEWQRSQGFAIEELDLQSARSREPALPPDLRAAWYIPGVGSLSLYRLTQALAMAASALGATILAETPVAAIEQRERTVTGVRLADRTISADIVILATGAWTRLLGDTVGVHLPTKPVKGQLVAFRSPLGPKHVLAGHGGYARPRVDGTTIVAATEEDAGFDRRVTGDGVAWLLELTRTICPSLLAGELVESWTGLRPGTDGGEPLIGPVPGVEGLWVAAGHFRTGAKEGPATAELVATSIVSGRVDPLLAPFSPRGEV